jgi:hypothetical protein
LYWQQAQRDAAVKACAEFLTIFGEHLRYTGKYEFEPYPEATARLTFDPLDHPATLREASSHQAIFSLEGQGERRIYKLSSVPMRARWLALKKYPRDLNGRGANGKPVINQEYEQEAWVWQAEEVKTAAGWERYFGVVGPHEIEKVPAAEIDFPN